MRTIAILLALALPAFGADIYPRVGYSGILITSVLGATDLTPAPPENPTGPAAIAGMAVDETGWQLEVYINNLSTGGSYAYGFDTNNNVVAGTKLAMNVTSQGYTDACVATTLTRTVYGTQRIRKPYPDEATADEAIVGDTVKIKLALSDYVYSGDSNLTATVLEGLYVQGGTNSLAATSMTVTNRSAATYPAVIANNSFVGYQLTEAGATNFAASMVAFHKFGQNGNPVAAVKFTATDGSTTLTNIVTAPTTNNPGSDKNPVIEYIYNIPLASLASSNLITVNWTVYPWVGNNPLSTTDGTNTMPSANYAPIGFVNDNAGTWKRTWANVSPSGNNATGVAIDSASWSTNTAAFATINGAINAITSSNNTWYGRNDVGGGKIFLEAGEHLWTGGTAAQGNEPMTYVEVTRMPHADRSTVIVTNSNGDTDISEKVLVRDVTLQSSSTSMFSGVNNLWIDNCHINTSSSAIVNACTIWSLTGNLITRMPQGASGFATAADPFLVRGNTFDLTNAAYHSMNVTIGNTRLTNAYTSASQFRNMRSGVNPRLSSIFAYNTLYGNQNTAAHYLSANLPDGLGLHGLAIVQNMIECGVSTVNGVGLVADDDTTNANNIVIWHNTWPGIKVNWFYNSSGSTARYFKNVSIKGNFMDDTNIKSDTFPTEDGGRIGNWAAVNSVGWSHNALPETYNVGANGSFQQEFYGIASFSTSSTTTNTWPQFVNRQAYTTATVVGDGDYRVRTTSPLTNYVGAYLLPYDLNGYPRSTNNVPGAFVELVAP